MSSLLVQNIGTIVWALIRCPPGMNEIGEGYFKIIKIVTLIWLRRWKWR